MNQDDIDKLRDLRQKVEDAKVEQEEMNEAGDLEDRLQASIRVTKAEAALKEFMYRMGLQS